MKRLSQRHSSMKPRDEERGVALIMCLFALVLLSSIALGLIYMSDTETTINQNFRSSQQAYFGAVAGLEEVRSRMTPGMAGGIAAPLVLPGAGAGSVVYILNPTLKPTGLENIDPMNPANPWFDDELCHGNFPALKAMGMVNPGANLPCTPVAPAAGGWWTYVNSSLPTSGTSAALNFKWVRVNLKVNASAPALPMYVDGGGNSATYGTQVCWDGANEQLLQAAACDAPPVGGTVMEPVYVVTALAQGSRRLLQAEVAQNPPLVTNAAVDSQDHVTLNGQLSINGYDFCSCACTKDPTTGVTSCTGKGGKACENTKWGIYSASTVDNPNKSETIVAGPNPPVAENMPWIYDIGKLIKTYSSGMNVMDIRKAPYNVTCVPQSNPNYPPDCGTVSGASFGVPPTFPPSPPDNPTGPANMATQTTYVPGDLHVTGNTQGNGILIVDGDLDIDGGMQFYGLILVRGVVKFTGGGSQKTNIYGSVLAGQQSIDDTVLGGSASIFFDMCALMHNRQPQPPSTLSFRELTY